MMIKIRDKINFDVVVEHRSTTVLHWLYYMMNNRVFVGDVFSLHRWGIYQHIDDHQPAYIIHRNHIDRFYNGFTAFTSRILKRDVDINRFVSHLTEWSYHPSFHIYLDRIQYRSNHTLLSYDNIESLITIFETTYHTTIPDNLKWLPQVQKPVVNQTLSPESIEIIGRYYTDV